LPSAAGRIAKELISFIQRMRGINRSTGGAMEAFFDPHTNKPVTQISLAEGETKVLGLKKFQPDEVDVDCPDLSVATCLHACHSNDSTKKSYNDNYNLYTVGTDTTPVELKGSIFFQISGDTPGRTQLTARFRLNPSSSYASPMPVTVTESKKRIAFVPAVGFDVLWRNHPLNPANAALYEDPNHPCTHAHLVGQCMVRFCTALNMSGVNLHGLHGKKCGIAGNEHQHHFINPYDFEPWKGVKHGYVWEAKPPYQREPMPGFAAYFFTKRRRGVILFWNYFSADKKKGDMFGGHIDLWNRDRMGNTFDRPVQSRGLSAFARARKIVFWPLE
jgi:hypothetical protein